MSSQHEDTASTSTAGVFDIRNVIGGLIGFYGLVLVVVGFVEQSKSALAKAGGVNANLWAGFVMIVGAVAFILWSRLRPIVVVKPPDESGADRSAD